MSKLPNNVLFEMTRWRRHELTEEEEIHLFLYLLEELGMDRISQRFKDRARVLLSSGALEGKERKY